MRTANVADFKSHLSDFLQCVEKGEEVTVCRRNHPVAILRPLQTPPKENKTRLGCGAGSVTIQGDLTEPALPAESWDMLTS